MNTESRATAGKTAFGKKPSRPGGRPSRGGEKRGGAGRRPRGGGKKKLNPAQSRQAKNLVEQSGIPYHAAVRVVLGKTSLNEILQQMLREEKIQKLIETHGINRALATNIALGRTDLNVVLLRRRKNETLQSHYAQSCLEGAAAKGNPLAVGIHGHKKLRGKVIKVDKYTFDFLAEGDSESIEIHKTAAKFAYDPDHYKQLRKFLGLDNKVKQLNLEPILRAKDRYHFKNLLLQQSIDDRTELFVTTLEGDTFRGQVEWFGRWEFGLKFKGGIRVTIFRHAVYQVRPHK